MCLACVTVRVWGVCAVFADVESRPGLSLFLCFAADQHRLQVQVRNVRVEGTTTEQTGTHTKNHGRDAEALALWLVGWLVGWLVCVTLCDR